MRSGLVATVLFVVMQITGCATVMALEETDYTVKVREGDFELRQYAPHIVAETIVTGNFDQVGSLGFRRLYRYISGNNKGAQEIAMTAPVNQDLRGQKIVMTAPVNQQQSEGQWRITFLMPSDYTLASLPEPLDPKVTLREMPGLLMAALQYSGTWSRSRYLQHEQRLQEWVDAKQLTAIGEPVFARYDPPFMPWFLRRNEVLIPLAN